VLRALHGSQVDRMADLLAEVAVAPGASVMEVGDEVTDFVVIKAGAVVSTRPVGGADGDSGETVDTQLGRYDFFNEEALLDDGRKSRTSIKAGPEGATLMRLDRKQFLQLLGDHSIDQYIAEAQQRRAVLAAQQAEAQAAEGSASAVALSTLQRLPPLAGPGDSTDVSTETGLCRFDDANLLTLRVVSKSRALRLQQESELVKERALLKTLPHDDVCSHLFPELLCTDSDTKCLYSLYHFPAACSLAELMDSNGDGVAALGVEGARFVSAALLLATKRAHELGMLLRSIAPEGIMMDGANGYPRLYDLRVAKVRVLPPQIPPASMYGSACHSTVTHICPPRLHTRVRPQLFEAGYDKDERTYTLCGSPEYLAPEQVVGGGSKGHGYAADYWALGALLFEMLTGNTPFTEAASGGRRRSAIAADAISETELFDRIVAHKGGIATSEWFAGVSWGGLTKATVASPCAEQASKMLAERSAKDPLTEPAFADDAAGDAGGDGGLLGVSAFAGF